MRASRGSININNQASVLPATSPVLLLPEELELELLEELELDEELEELELLRPELDELDELLELELELDDELELLELDEELEALLISATLAIWLA